MDAWFCRFWRTREKKNKNIKWKWKRNVEGNLSYIFLCVCVSVCVLFELREFSSHCKSVTNRWKFSLWQGKKREVETRRPKKFFDCNNLWNRRASKQKKTEKSTREKFTRSSWNMCKLAAHKGSLFSSFFSISLYFVSCEMIAWRTDFFLCYSHSLQWSSSVESTHSKEIFCAQM